MYELITSVAFLYVRQKTVVHRLVEKDALTYVQKVSVIIYRRTVKSTIKELIHYVKQFVDH